MKNPTEVSAEDKDRLINGYTVNIEYAQDGKTLYQCMENIIKRMNSSLK